MVFARLMTAAASRIGRVAAFGVGAGAVAHTLTSNALPLPATVACASDDSVIDRDSNKTFLKRLTLFSGNPGVLIGAACRRRFGLFSVYGVGLYVAEDDVDSLSTTTDILRGSTEAQLQLKFCRSVEDGTVSNSMKEAMAPRMPKGEEETLDRFLETFNDLIGGPAYDGLVVGFHWSAGTLTTFVEDESGDSRTELSIKSESIPRALFAVYIDDDAVVPAEKFIDGLQNLKQAAIAAAADAASN